MFFLFSRVYLEILYRVHQSDEKVRVVIACWLGKCPGSGSIVFTLMVRSETRLGECFCSCGLRTKNCSSGA